MPSLAPGVYTFQFPERKIITGDFVKLEIKFFASGVGPMVFVNYDAHEMGVFLHKIGSIEYEWDVENFALVAGRFSPVLIDMNGELSKFLFDYYNNVDRRAYVVLSVKWGDGTYLHPAWTPGAQFEEEFSGYIIADTITHKKRANDRLIEFSAAPRIENLNTTMVYDLNGQPINPLGYNPPTIFPTNVPIWFSVPIPQLLEDIYRVAVNNLLLEPGVPTVTISGFSNLKFRARTSIEPPEIITDGTFDELQPNVFHFFFDSSFGGYRTLGDVLRMIGLSFGAYTGLVSQNKAFFRKLFPTSYDVILTRILDYHESLRLHPITYVHFLSSLISVLNKREERSYAAGTFSNVEGTYIDKTINVGIEDLISAESWPSSVMITRYGEQWPLGYQNFTVTGIRDEDLVDPSSSFVPLAQWLAQLWYSRRSLPEGERIDYFKLPLLRYRFDQNFLYSNVGYQPVRLSKDFDDGTTEIEAIVVDRRVLPTVTADPIQTIFQQSKVAVDGFIGEGLIIKEYARNKFELTIDRLRVRDTFSAQELHIQQSRVFNDEVIIGKTGSGRGYDAIKVITTSES